MSKDGPIIPIYGVPIQDAAACGDLKRMKAVAREAERHLKQHGNVSAALEALKLEIAKLEHQKKK